MAGTAPTLRASHAASIAAHTTGFEEVDVITGPDDPAIAGCAVVIVPSEAPELGERIRGVAPLVEFGNVLDAGSVRMVSELVDEVRERKGRLVA